MKNILVLIIGCLFLSKAIASNDTNEAVSGKALISKYGVQLSTNLSVGLLDARIEGACLKQVDGSRTYIANKKVCSLEVNEQLAAVDGIVELSEYAVRLIQYKHDYSL
jgi:hypothetical protein